jgi:hypothetical protein
MAPENVNVTPLFPGAGALNEMMPPLSRTLERGSAPPSMRMVPPSVLPFWVMTSVPCRRGVPPGGICSMVHVPMSGLCAGAASLESFDAKASAANRRSVRARRNIGGLTVVLRNVARMTPVRGRDPVGA